MLTDDELKAIEQRAEAAKLHPQTWAAVDFIKAAGADIPALLATVNELKAEIERLRGELFVYANRGSWTHEAGLRNDKTRDDIWIFDEPGYISAANALKGSDK